MKIYRRAQKWEGDRGKSTNFIIILIIKELFEDCNSVSGGGFALVPFALGPLKFHETPLEGGLRVLDLPVHLLFSCQECEGAHPRPESSWQCRRRGEAGRVCTLCVRRNHYSRVRLSHQWTQFGKILKCVTISEMITLFFIGLVFPVLVFSLQVLLN